MPAPHIGARDWPPGILGTRPQHAVFLCAALQLFILSGWAGSIERWGPVPRAGRPTRPVPAPMLGLMMPG